MAGSGCELRERRYVRENCGRHDFCPKVLLGFARCERRTVAWLREERLIFGVVVISTTAPREEEDVQRLDVRLLEEDA